jgi:hypothetical protein
MSYLNVGEFIVSSLSLRGIHPGLFLVGRHGRIFSANLKASVIKCCRKSPSILWTGAPFIADGCVVITKSQT